MRLCEHEPQPMSRRIRLASALAFAAALTAVLAASGPAAPVAGTWRPLPAAPIAPDAGLTSVWTGKEMIVFGRRESRSEDGAVLGRVNLAEDYDPGANSWRSLPSPGATGSFMDDSAVWTGKEMVVWGQGTREAFNPMTNRWRQLPPVPLAAHDAAGLVVWTGHEMIGWGGGCCGDAFSDGAAYNPSTNRWRKLAPSPLAGSAAPIGAWTGRELVILVGNLDPDGKPWPSSLARAAAYNPATDKWRRIAALPAPRAGANAVWDGREMLVAGGWQSGPPQATAAVGFAYDPKRNRWRRLPRMEKGRVGAAAVWTGTRLLVWGGQTQALGAAAPNLPGHGLAYDPKTNRWSPLLPAPILGRTNPTAVWTGRELIVWGGGDSYPPFADGAAFRPTAP